jgi:hypothetical protein
MDARLGGCGACVEWLKRIFRQRQVGADCGAAHLKKDEKKQAQGLLKRVEVPTGFSGR